MKIHIKDRWENIKHYETRFIEEIINIVGENVQYDDDTVEFDIEISKIKVSQ